MTRRILSSKRMAAKLHIRYCGKGRMASDESYPDRDEPRWDLEFSGIGMCIDAQLFKPVHVH
jgi:hypothetical protein